MAIRKPGSRFTDRNRIRKMHAEGYSVEQISEAVSITIEHINYVLNEWDSDEENFRDKQRQMDRDREEEKRRQMQPANPVPNVTEEERQRLIEQGRREAQAEAQNGQAEAADKAETEAPAEEEPKRRPRRRKQPAVDRAGREMEDEDGNPIPVDEREPADET